MNLKLVASGLLYLTTLVAAEDYDDYYYDDDGSGWDDDEWGLCYYDDQCIFSCGDAKSPEDCLGYLQAVEGAIPINVPYFKGPDGICGQTNDHPEKMGRCCTTCDSSDADYYCTPYWIHPDGCKQQGYTYFYDVVEVEKPGSTVVDSEDMCFEVDEEGNRVYEEDPKKGSGSGDPHFKTWTGEKFDYHGECDLVLVDNPTFMDGLGLKVHIRTTRVTYYSFIERIAVQIGEDVLEFANDVNTFTINGQVVGPPKKHHKNFLSGFLVRQDKKAISIRLSKENYKIGSPKIDLVQRAVGFPAVIVNSEGTDIFKGSLGLLGDYETGKKTARDGETVIEDATKFALEWQVRNTEPMLFHEARFPQFPTQCRPPRKMMGKRLGYDRMRASAEEACSAWKEDKEDCIFDVMATRDIEVAKEGSVQVA